MEGELIYVSIISSLFAILGIYILNHNWFKKENFKVKRDLERSENKLKLKKLERELGLQGTIKQELASAPAAGTSNLLLQLAPLLKNLEPDQLAALIDIFTGGGAEGGEGGGGLADILGSFAANNPELVQGILDGIKNKIPPKQGEGF